MPARNEKYLNRTIRSLLSQAAGPVEVLVGLDGWDFDYEVVRDERVRVYRVQDPIGRRAMTNRLAERADGEYLFKFDAHCRIMTPGFDARMKCVCGPGDLVTASLDKLDGETWEPKGSRLYSLRLTPEFDAKWWSRYKPLPGEKVMEVLCPIGAAYVIRAETFRVLGGHNEDLSHWGTECQEFACKVWLSGGRCLCRADTLVGHLYRKQFPYCVRYEQSADREKLKALYSGPELDKLLVEFDRKYDQRYCEVKQNGCEILDRTGELVRV
jgi:hypothetical protein